MVAGFVILPLAALVPAAPVSAAPGSAEFGAPNDIAADYYGALLRHTRWVETVWDANAGVYRFADFNFAVVLGNAVLLTHGEYDEQLAGVPEEELRQKTIATIQHYASTNRNVNPAGNWGKRLFWDSTFQSYFLLAGKLMWDELNAQTRTNLTTIAVEQSRYTASLEMGRDDMSGSWTADWPDGKYLGDTAQEEVGVYTQALSPGLAWAPDHAEAEVWDEQLGDWGRNAAGQPTADRNNPAVVAGKAIDTNTMQNIHDSYLVENHGSFGPHYQSDIWRSGGRNAIHFLVNDQPIPEIVTEQPNAAELWEVIKMTMSDQGEPLMPMVADREFLYGRDVLPIAFLGQVLRDPDAVRAEANLAAALEAYQAYTPVDRLTKFSGEPKYEPEARAEIAIAYLLHVEAAESDLGNVEPTPQDEFFSRMAGVRDFGEVPGLTVQQTENAWAAAGSKQGFVKFPWVPEHDSWLFHISGASEFLYPRTGVDIDERYTDVYTGPRDGFEATASMFEVGGEYAGQVTLPTGSAIYATSGNGVADGEFSVRNLEMSGYNGLDGSRTYTTAEGTVTESQPEQEDVDPADVNAHRIDTFDFDPVQARYVRMQGEQGHPTFGYSMYAFHVYGPGGDDDLAAGRPATASSQANSGDRSAGAATNGNPTHRWAVSTGDRGRLDSWIQVDLGAATSVDSVRLAWESSAGVRYRIETSLDGVTWETQDAYDGGNAADVTASRVDSVELIPSGETEPAPVEARYVRMQGLQASPQYGYSLFHFRALTPEGTNAALNRPVSASSHDGTFVPANATNGNPSNRWAVARDQRSRHDSWIQVDLGTPTQISEVQLAWEVAAGRVYRIETSLDGEEWSESATFRFTGNEILNTSGNWLNIEGKGGFVVRGADAPINVSATSDIRHQVRLLDDEDGNDAPALVEMLTGGPTVTSARAAVAQPTTGNPRLLASNLDGYLSLFNVSDDDIEATVAVPHAGAAVSLFQGTQVVGSSASELEVSVPAGTAAILAPRFTVQRADVPSEGMTATVVNAATVRLASDAGVDVAVRNIQTGDSVDVAAAGHASLAAAVIRDGSTRFDGAQPYPIADLALGRLTFPASVLPEGMSSPQNAVDNDADTSWVPGPNGRMVVDLHAARDIGAVSVIWDGDDAPEATVSVSDDGLTFRDVGTPEVRRGLGVLEVEETARFVALTTSWSTGDPGVAALRVLPRGIEQEEAPLPIEGELPTWRVGEVATGQLTSEGTPAPTFAITSGTLPAGVAFDEVAGSFSGTPTVAGDFEFTVTASNDVGVDAVRVFSGTVLAADEEEPPPGGGPGGGGGGTGGGDGSGGGTGPGDGSGGGSGSGDDGLSATGPAGIITMIAIAAMLAAAGVMLVMKRRGRWGPVED